MNKNTFSGEGLFCKRGERNVFSELSFSVNAGEALIIRGPNGSGKSSLLRLMAGILKPREGRMLWNGQNIDDRDEEHKATLHYIGHLNPIKPIFTVYENIYHWNQIRLNPTDIEKALEKFNIKHLRNVSGRFLSAGQVRLANLARIVASPADLWLLDEPTTALDSQAILALEHVIKAFQSAGGIVIISTHVNIALTNKKEINLSQFFTMEPH